MLSTSEQIDVTDILAAPNEFAARLRKAERERDNLVAQVEHLTSELRTNAETSAAQTRELATVRGIMNAQTERIAEMTAQLAALPVLTELVERKVGALERFAKMGGLSISMCGAWHTEFRAALAALKGGAK